MIAGLGRTLQLFGLHTQYNPADSSKDSWKIVLFREPQKRHLIITADKIDDELISLLRGLKTK